MVFSPRTPVKLTATMIAAGNTTPSTEEHLYLVPCSGENGKLEVEILSRFRNQQDHTGPQHCRVAIVMFQGGNRNVVGLGDGVKSLP